MRTLIYDYINGLDLGTFALTNEQPRSESNVPLYVKNLKRLYISVAQYDAETLLTTLDGANIQNEIVTVSVFFACDSKTLPSNYVILVTQLLKVNDIVGIAPSWNRKAVQTTNYEADKLITQIDYTFTKIKTA